MLRDDRFLFITGFLEITCFGYPIINRVFSHNTWTRVHCGRFKLAQTTRKTVRWHTHPCLLWNFLPLVHYAAHHQIFGKLAENGNGWAIKWFIWAIIAIINHNSNLTAMVIQLVMCIVQSFRKSKPTKAYVGDANRSRLLGISFDLILSFPFLCICTSCLAGIDHCKSVTRTLFVLARSYVGYLVSS